MKFPLRFAWLFPLSIFPGAIFGAHSSAQESAPSDAELFQAACIVGFLNQPSEKVTLNEAFCLQAVKGQQLDHFAQFKKACATNNISVIKEMLREKQISSEQAGMSVINLGGSINDECAKAISSEYPYAVWDGHGANLERYPNFTDTYIKRCLDRGFILPYQRFEPRAIITYTPILHYYVLVRTIIKHEPEQVLADPDYNMVEKLLQLGANPHFKGYCWFIWDDRDAFYFTENTRKQDEGPKLKALLEKYAKGPINDKGEFNTTDMFYPGTIFYREKL